MTGSQQIVMAFEEVMERYNSTLDTLNSRVSSLESLTYLVLILQIVIIVLFFSNRNKNR